MQVPRKVTVFEYYRPEGQPTYEKREIGTGILLSFGVDFEDFGYGVGNYTTAIVEMPDGEILTPVVDLIRMVGGDLHGLAG